LIREPRRDPDPWDFLDVGDRFPGATAASAITISTLTETARDVVEGAFIPLWVRGEVTDFKAHRNGNWYFCLRDRMAQIRCVVWKRDMRGIVASPDDGMQVAVFGRLTVYPARGEIQFAVSRMEAEGDGLRRKALELTRARLEADGLLRPERKRPLPRFPRIIAVVTSPDGAALHDIVAVVRRRAAGVRLVVVPAAVQGDSAPDELCFAFDQVNRWGAADLVIVGRGGGAREDLWAFNNERVARAVAACHVPTISAVGHEIDISICDLVADHRAPTPSAAAEAATRSRAELAAELRRTGERMASGVSNVLYNAENAVRRKARDLRSAARAHLDERRDALGKIAGRLHGLSPVATLARGYAVARGLDGTTLGSVSQFANGMPFDLVVRDGVVPSVVRDAPEPRSDAP
jgi:exodeoxyribonuclease VII large subunit